MWKEYEKKRTKFIEQIKEDLENKIDEKLGQLDLENGRVLEEVEK